MSDDFWSDSAGDIGLEAFARDGGSATQSPYRTQVLGDPAQLR
jgi:hypothetical protein